MPYLNYATAVREGRLAEYEAQRVVARGAFEERRGTRVENLKRELVRENLLDPRKLDNVPYYYTIEEQNLFLDSITNGQTFGRSEYNYWSDLEPEMYLGQTLKAIQYRFNKEMGIPLILPKFSNLNNISVKEQQFLAMQGVDLQRDREGRYGAGLGPPGARIFKNIEDTGGKSGAYYQFVEPSEYYISIGAVPSDMLREIEVHGAVSGTGFQRGRGYVGDEPEITTSQVEPQVEEVIVEKPFDKPERERVFGPEPEPEITTDHIEPPSEEQDFLPPTSQVQPSEPEPEVTTSQIESDFNPPGWDRPYDYGTEAHQEAEPDLFPTTSQVDPPGVEEPEPEVTTSQVDPPGQEVTAEISWFGDTWFPWHLELEDKRRR